MGWKNGVKRMSKKKRKENRIEEKYGWETGIEDKAGRMG